MAIMQDMGGDIGAQTSHIAKSDIAILLDDHCSRYKDGYQTFRLQSTLGCQPNTKVLTNQTLDLTNLLNEDTSKFKQIAPVQKAACVRLKLPREIRRTFKDKFIPVGSRFIVEFTGSDINKGVITSREDDQTGNVTTGNMNEMG